MTLYDQADQAYFGLMNDCLPCLLSAMEALRGGEAVKAMDYMWQAKNAANANTSILWTLKEDLKERS